MGFDIKLKKGDERLEDDVRKVYHATYDATVSFENASCSYMLFL